MTSPITPDSPILGPTDPVATVAAALAYVTSRTDLGPVVTPMAVESYIRELYRLCLLSGIRFEVAAGQAFDECNVFRDKRFWGEYGNPVGYGAEETLEHPGEINYTGGRWTPVGAARVHLVHLWLYAVGTTLPESLAPYSALDTRWALAVAHGYAGKAPTLAGLSGRWAANPNYAVQIAAHANRAFKETAPVADITFGRVPKPTIVNRIIPDADNWAWDSLGPRSVLGVVYHTQVGTNWGTDGWFRTLWQPDGTPAGGQLGLTDYGITRRGTEILQWNDPWGRSSKGVSPNRSPYASGPWERPPGGDGHAFVNKYGVNAINQRLASLEVDQFYETLFTDEGFATLVALSAWIADQAKVPHDTYPINPATGLTFTYLHNEFQNHKPCAGAVIIGRVDELIAATAARMKRFQTGAEQPVPTPIPPKYATPIIPPFLKKIPWIQEVPFNNVVLTLRTDVYRSDKDGIKVFQLGSTTSGQTRAPLKQGEEFVVVYGWEKGSERWGLTPFGSRVLLNDCTRIKEWQPVQVDAPAKAA